jgi:hypothetical protein
MPNAQQSFIRIWKRAVAALSLVAAALLAPTAAAPVGGAGVAGSRVGNGPAVASAANAMVASMAGVVDGKRSFPLDEPEADGPHASPCVLAAEYELPAPSPAAAAQPDGFAAPRAPFAPRSGRTRAPPPLA